MLFEGSFYGQDAKKPKTQKHAEGLSRNHFTALLQFIRFFGHDLLYSSGRVALTSSGEDVTISKPLNGGKLILL